MPSFDQVDSNHISDEDISAQAAEWLVILDDQVDDETQKKFAMWLAQDKRHGLAIERIQRLLGDVEQLQQHYQDSSFAKEILEDALTTSHQSRKHYVYKGVLSLALMSVLVVIFSLQYAPLNYWTADQRNRSQSWQQHTLQDKSRIKVSGKTAYNIQFTQQKREIELLQGNILVDVAKDKTRPFQVKTPHGIVQALGTRFIVTQDGQTTILTMLESKTAVWSEQKPQQVVMVIAGQRIEMNKQGIVTQYPVQINAQLFEQAWNKQVMVANGENLTDVLDYLAIYYAGKIRFDRENLTGIQVTATLPLNNIDQALQQLAIELNLEITESVPYSIHVRRK